MAQFVAALLPISVHSRGSATRLTPARRARGASPSGARQWRAPRRWMSHCVHAQGSGTHPRASRVDAKLLTDVEHVDVRHQECVEQTHNPASSSSEIREAGRHNLSTRWKLLEQAARDTAADSDLVCAGQLGPPRRRRYSDQARARAGAELHPKKVIAFAVGEPIRVPYLKLYDDGYYGPRSPTGRGQCHTDSGFGRAVWRCPFDISTSYSSTSSGSRKLTCGPWKAPSPAITQGLVRRRIRSFRSVTLLQSQRTARGPDSPVDSQRAQGLPKAAQQAPTWLRSAGAR
jgi:hypothetical protein